MSKETFLNQRFDISENPQDVNKRGRDSQEIPPNIQRHNENLRLLTGWRGGTWYENGVANPGNLFKDISGRSRGVRGRRPGRRNGSRK